MLCEETAAICCLLLLEWKWELAGICASLAATRWNCFLRNIGRNRRNMLERLDLFIWQRIWYFNVRHTFVSNRRNMLVCHEMHDYWLFANIRTFGGIWMKSSCFPVLTIVKLWRNCWIVQDWSEYAFCGLLWMIGRDVLEMMESARNRRNVMDEQQMQPQPENASSRTYVDLDQESNTHDNRLSPTIKCGIEGVTQT